MVGFEALLCQIMKDIGIASVQIVLSHHTYPRTMLRTGMDTLLLCLRQPIIVSSFFVRIGIGLVKG